MRMPLPLPFHCQDASFALQSSSHRKSVESQSLLEEEKENMSEPSTPPAGGGEGKLMDLRNKFEVTQVRIQKMEWECQLVFTQV